MYGTHTQILWIQVTNGLGDFTMRELFGLFSVSDIADSDSNLSNLSHDPITNSYSILYFVHNDSTRKRTPYRKEIFKTLQPFII